MDYVNIPANQRRPPGPADAIGRTIFYLILIGIAAAVIYVYTRGIPSHPQTTEPASTMPPASSSPE